MSSPKVALASAFVTLAALASCLSEGDRSAVEFACPSEEEFPIVSQVLEQKCGTLDCHGDRSRPFRLFGRNGARLSESDVVGATDGTSPAEMAENRASACGLEPEKMSSVVAGETSLDELSLTRKPRLIEAHKGGRVWTDDAPGYVCLASWIDGELDLAACEAELVIP